MHFYFSIYVNLDVAIYLQLLEDYLLGWITLKYRICLPCKIWHFGTNSSIYGTKKNGKHRPAWFGDFDLNISSNLTVELIHATYLKKLEINGDFLLK